MDPFEKKIVYQAIETKSRYNESDVVHQGNYEGQSKNMEIEGFQESIKFLESTGILKKVKYFVSDKEASISKLFAEQSQLKHITLLLDPGHTKKNFKKQLEKICGETPQNSLWPEKFSNWYMTSIKEAERIGLRSIGKKLEELSEEEFCDYRNKIQSIFRFKFSSGMKHFKSKKCEYGCPCINFAFINESPGKRIEIEKVKNDEELFLFAIQEGNWETFWNLLLKFQQQNKSLTSIHTEDGFNSLHFAAYYNRYNMVKELLPHIDETISSDGEIKLTPALIAKLKGHSQVLSLFGRNYDLEIGGYIVGYWRLFIELNPYINFQILLNLRLVSKSFYIFVTNSNLFKSTICRVKDKNFVPLGSLPGDEKVEEKITQVVQNFLDNSEQVLHGFNTCLLENLNMQRTKYNPKNLELWQHYSERSQAVALFQNNQKGQSFLKISEKLGVKQSEPVKRICNEIDRKSLTQNFKIQKRRRLALQRKTLLSKKIKSRSDLSQKYLTSQTTQKISSIQEMKKLTAAELMMQMKLFGLSIWDSNHKKKTKQVMLQELTQLLEQASQSTQQLLETTQSQNNQLSSTLNLGSIAKWRQHELIQKMKELNLPTRENNGKLLVDQMKLRILEKLAPQNFELKQKLIETFTQTSLKRILEECKLQVSQPSNIYRMREKLIQFYLNSRNMVNEQQNIATTN